MGLLDRLEQSIERLLEGTSGSLFRQKLQPVEIGKRLERTMMSQQRVSVDARLVPNAYVVRLNPKDYEQFEGFKSGLTREMESWLAGVASQHRLTMLDRISVSFVADPNVSERNPQVEAEISDLPRRPPSRQQPHRSGPRQKQARAERQIIPPRPVGGTEVLNVPRKSTSGDDQGHHIQLQVVSGEYTDHVFPIREGNSSLGRAADNMIVLDSADVSRHHARLERTGQHLRIYDLNSTNGTKVNGEAVHISDIQSGDHLNIGSQTLLVTIDEADRDADRKRWW